MASILVTGGAGFIGSHIADECINMGDKCMILDDLSGGLKENINPKAKFVHGSILDFDLVNNLFEEEQFDYVYHLAAYAAEGLSPFIKRFNYNNNLVGSCNIINACVNFNIKCLVFTSSIAVYGSNQTPFSEETMPIPEDSYGIAKYAVEQELAITSKMFGLPYVIFRPHNVYGERQNIADKYRNVVGIFMRQLMLNKPVVVFGDGKQTRCFTYINDIVSPITMSARIPEMHGEVFNIGTDSMATVNELAQLVGDAIGKQPQINHYSGRNEVKHAIASHKKAHDFFNDMPDTSLKTGISQMWDYVQKQKAVEPNDFSEIEIMRNLPSAWLT